MNNGSFELLNKLKSGELTNKVKLEKINNSDDIAIIGISIKLSNAENLSELFNVLYNGTNCISSLSKERMDDVNDYLGFKGVSKESYQFINAAFLPEIDKFDFPFFKISAKEASLMDPLQRLFLETSWHAFEDAGYTRQKLKGTKTGVFLGHPYPTEYYKRVKEIEPEMAIMAGPGNIDSIIGSRIAYIFDLTGVSLSVDTACSSALVAVHLACQSIKNNECEMALVGGINLLLEPIRYKGEQVPDIASPTDKVKTFSDDADGTVQGEGCIAIVLKSLNKAIRDKDNIYAVIKGSACNNDGASIGITAPSVSAQEKVITQAFENSNVNPETISYVEAHGTGTKLGDPIEIEAITNAFKKYTSRAHFCGIGSIKTNYGHLDSAAGLLGLVKCVIGLKTHTLFPTINFSEPNKNINFINSAVYVVDKVQPWENFGKNPRRCGISSFGLSGTNCHIILEEYVNNESKRMVSDTRCYLLPISAKTEVALMEYVKRYRDFLEINKDFDIRDICYTAQEGKEHYTYRLALLGDSREDFISKLEYITRNKFITNKKLGIYFGSLKGEPVTAISQLKGEKTLDINTEYMIELAQKFVTGTELDWKLIHDGEYLIKVSTPLYPFEKKRCWLKITENRNLQCKVESKERLFMEQTHLINNVDEENEILTELKRFVASLFEMEIAEVDENVNFFELGIDSISIIQLKQEIKNNFDMDISAEKLFGEINTLKNLSKYICANKPKEQNPSYTIKEPFQVDTKDETSLDTCTEENPGTVVENLKVEGRNGFEEIIKTQLEIMSQQLQLLKGANPTSNSINKSVPNIHNKTTIRAPKNDDNRLLQKFIVKSAFELTENQKAYIDKFIKNYVKKTQRSKDLAQEYRKKWANGRMTQGFSKPWKELVYPIFAKAAKGSKMWDVDGNEYVDFAMGFGVNLFGYNNPEIAKAIQNQLDNGIILGSLVTSPGEVAEMISEITGVERVAFCNSGTEAIMNAVRIARATTGKDKIVLFSGSFHGTFDGVYALKDITSLNEKAIPLSLGTPYNMVDDVIILDYGDEQSLERIKQHADELAAVLVEPVQSRTPDLQPREFLLNLRKITSDAGIALIFDEIITGFRINIGGAQAFFNIEADIVAYGKILGGGLPIGVFAGKSKFMDRVDGGTWNYHDDSAPSGFLAHTGGTFCHHPLAMVAAKATLELIKKGGNAIQEDLNEKTSLLANYLNSYFERCEIPLKIAHFGSLFIFKIDKETTLLRFLFYKLIEKGFYLWEGATCFISTAHTVDEIASFAKAVQECCYELVQEGCFHFKNVFKPADVTSIKHDIFMGLKNNRFISESLSLIYHESDRLKAKELFEKAPNIEAIYPLSPMQERILSQNINYKGTGNDISILSYKIDGNINVADFKRAWDIIVNRHPILRTTILWRRLKNPLQVINGQVGTFFEEVDFTDVNKDELLERSKEYLEREKMQSFDTTVYPLMKVILIKVSQSEHKLIIKYLNSLFDGWSSGLMFGELLDTYKSLVTQQKINYINLSSYMDYISWLKTQKDEDARAFWGRVFQNFKFDTNNYSAKYQVKGSIEPSEYSININESELNNIKKFTSQNNLTVYTLFLGAWAILHSNKEERDDVIISTICSGRPTSIPGIDKVVGLFSNVLPLRIAVSKTNLVEWLKKIQENNLKLRNFEHVTVSQISHWCNIPIELLQESVYTKTLVYLNFPKSVGIKELDISIELEEEKSYVNVPLRVYIEPYANYRVVAQYDKSLLSEDYVAELLRSYKNIILDIIENREELQ
ncbi:aminotransferase class III-fold pyridoxal phosphate-dependent enzyme [Ruminiclostridium josui]|uniref:aminotransferase class III-fold pyridoxal phosphate-dependent enzyme n=1 Tax=Ruminiclostridium josui TaxID=1499 RepID=UPI000467710E|nr:aminotransferase class III-fold pyridoxal phosphate-dependent enzyme [Ruminiclostridium josui]